MVFELRTYTIKMGGMHDYLTLFETVGLPIISRYAKLVGHWQAASGELNQVLHLWSYDSLDERTRQHHALFQDEEWLTAFIPKALTLIEKQESRILTPDRFSPLQ